MIPSYVSVPEKAPQDEKIVVLDAGGTHFSGRRRRQVRS